VPAVEVDDEINRAGFAKSFGNEDRNRAITVVLCCGEKLAFIRVPFGALCMRKRSGCEWFCN